MDLDRIKQLRRTLTLHFAIIAVLTAMLVATGSGSIFLPVFILMVTVFAYIFVDRLEWFEIGRIGSYVGMTSATAIAIGGYIYSVVNDSESGQLLAVAGLLVYPEAVLFLQKKNLRIYEQLAVFLLLEMIVAALVNDNIVFGILLTPIMVLWVSSLFLFSRYASLVQMDPAIEEPMPKLAEVLFRRFMKSVMGESKHQPLVTAKAVPKKDVQSSKTLRRSVQSIPIGIGAIVFAALFFYLVPRTSPGDFQTSFGDKSAVGLPTRLTFGRFGQLLQNRVSVMRVSLKPAFPSSDDKEVAYELESPPYLRSLIFDRYAYHYTDKGKTRGQWDFEKTPAYRDFKKVQKAGQLTKYNRDAVIVEFDIERKFVSSMYSVPPIYYTQKDLPVKMRYDGVHMIFQKMDESNYLPTGKSLIYEVGSVAFEDGEQIKITPAKLLPGNNFSPEGDRERIREINRLRGGGSVFPVANKYRQEFIERKRIATDDNVRFATALEDHFVFSGEFSYSLDLRPPADPDIDVIEDFLVNSKVGHCQYFASAMTMLLRQQGIASRIVVGYRPREFNTIGDYFLVRQSDAHAWVEGLFSREELVGTEYERWLTDSQFYWMRFDPTPGSDGDPAEIVEQEGQAMDYAEKLWKDYVVEGQKLTGENSLYDPVTSNGENAYEDLLNRLELLREQVRQMDFSGIGALWLGIISIGVGAVCIFGVWQFIVLLPKISPGLARRMGVLKVGAKVKQPFFAKTVGLLERLGLRRDASQTPLEFSKVAEQHLKQRGHDVEGSLGFLTWLYYRMQFRDGHKLTAEETKRMEADLKEVQQAVADVKAANR